MAKNANFEKSAKNGKNRGFSCFFSNSDHSFILMFFCGVRGLYRALFRENGRFGSNLGLQLRFEPVLTNHIARPFKWQYLKKALAVWADVLYIVVKPSVETACLVTKLWPKTLKFGHFGSLFQIWISREWKVNQNLFGFSESPKKVLS